MILYHGSPYGGLTSLAGVSPGFFLTPDHEVAKAYALQSMIGAQKDPGTGSKTPTIYQIEYNGKPFDMRLPENAQLYTELRKQVIASSSDPDITFDYPKIGISGFIDTHTGLPFFSKERPIYALVKHLGFDSVWVSESTQGPSLALFNPGIARIVGTQTPALQKSTPNMSLEDKLAKALLKKHSDYLTATQSDGWFTSIESQLETQEQLEYKRARIMIGDTELECLIAEVGAAQTQGLQGHSSIGPYEAMIFPYNEPRRVAFHMGEVKFPIDMIFVGDDSRVTRIVEYIEPGTPGNWGMPHILAVVEVNGGFCRAHNIEVGSEVGQIESEPKTAQQLANVNKLVSILGDAMYAGDNDSAEIVARQIEKLIHSGLISADEINGRLRDYMEMISEPKTAQEIFPSYPRKDINPKMVAPNTTHDRFKDRDLVDIQVNNQPMDPGHFEQEIGYDPANTEEQNEGIGPNVRPL